jgi:hypothetical protein
MASSIKIEEDMVLHADVYLSNSPNTDDTEVCIDFVGIAD